MHVPDQDPVVTGNCKLTAAGREPVSWLLANDTVADTDNALIVDGMVPEKLLQHSHRLVNVVIAVNTVGNVPEMAFM